MAFDVDGNLWIERSVSDGLPREADVYDTGGRLMTVVRWNREIDLLGRQLVATAVPRRSASQPIPSVFNGWCGSRGAKRRDRRRARNVAQLTRVAAGAADSMLKQPCAAPRAALATAAQLNAVR